MNASRFGKRLALFASTVALGLLSSSVLAQPQAIDRVVVFGTSLSDTGNAFMLLSQQPACGVSLNVPPYDALDELLVPDGPYAVGGHHFTNGATWNEVMARYLALAGNARPALANPGMKASNYAAGGARAVDHYCRFNLPDQLKSYLGDFPQTAASTLITMEIGGNDVRDALAMAAGGGNPGPVLQAALDSVAYSVQALYSRGARKFLLLNVPDIGKSPAVRMLDSVYPGTSAFANLITRSYNDGLAAYAQALRQLPGIDLRTLDLYSILNDIIADPASHGLSNVSDPCVTPNQPPFKCSRPDSYVFWDGTHPTKAVHDILAQEAIAAISTP